jgi:hypothetical protein
MLLVVVIACLDRIEFLVVFADPGATVWITGMH